MIRFLLNKRNILFIERICCLQFLDSWAWDSKNLEKNQINQKHPKKQSWMDLPKILLTGLVFLFFFGFPRVFGQLGLGQQKPREKPNKPKTPKKNNPEWTSPRFFSQDWSFCFFLVFLKFLDSWAWDSKNLEKNQKTQKTNPEWTYPRFFSQDCFFLFFLVFLEFLDSWAWDSKNLEKNHINQKNQSWMDLPKILLTGLFFFFGFPRVFGQLGLGTAKNLEKNEENQKKKTIWNRLTPDSSHRIVFLFLFGFPWLFWHMERWKWKKGKHMKKQKMQKPNAPSVPFCLYNGMADRCSYSKCFCFAAKYAKMYVILLVHLSRSIWRSYEYG